MAGEAGQAAGDNRRADAPVDVARAYSTIRRLKRGSSTTENAENTKRILSTSAFFAVSAVKFLGLRR